MTADLLPRSGTVHWIGAGLSTGSGLTAGLNRAAWTAAGSEQWLGELARDGVEFTLRVDR